MSLRQHIPIRRLPVAALLALALLTRLLLPAGWMPGADASGFRLEFCSSFGAPPPAMLKASEDAARRLIGGKHHGKDRENDGQACGFGALGLAWDVLVPPLFAAPLPPAMLSFLTTVTVTIGRGLAAPPPPATGPPFGA